MKPKCLNCGTRVAIRPRGLCKPCYDRPDVKERFQTNRRVKWYDRCTVVVPLPTEPTDAPPGTAEKIAIMTARDSAGHAIHHPLDVVIVAGLMAE